MAQHLPHAPGQDGLGSALGLGLSRIEQELPSHQVNEKDQKSPARDLKPTVSWNHSPKR